MKYDIISEKRLQEVQDYISAHDIELSYQDTVFHANVFETIGRFTHEKLSLETMIDTFTVALRVLEYCPNSGRISCIMNLMDFKGLPAELDKLNRGEKERFAFCIEYVLFMQTFGEVSGNEQSGMDLFTDVKKVRRMYSFLKKKTPEFFTEKSPWSKWALYLRVKESLASGGSNICQWSFHSYLRGKDFDDTYNKSKIAPTLPS